MCVLTQQVGMGPDALLFYWVLASAAWFMDHMLSSKVVDHTLSNKGVRSVLQIPMWGVSSGTGRVHGEREVTLDSQSVYACVPAKWLQSCLTLLPHGL